MKQVKFNYKKLSADILAKRTKEDLSFRVISAETGIPTQTLFRMEAGVIVPSCNNFALVLGWLDKPATDYFTTSKK